MSSSLPAALAAEDHLSPRAGTCAAALRTHARVKSVLVLPVARVVEAASWDSARMEARASRPARDPDDDSIFFCALRLDRLTSFCTTCMYCEALRGPVGSLCGPMAPCMAMCCPAGVRDCMSMTESKNPSLPARSQPHWLGDPATRRIVCPTRNSLIKPV